MPIAERRERRRLIEMVESYGSLLDAPAGNQILIQVTEPANVIQVAEAVAGAHYALVTAAANDERELEDNCFKIYYVFSHPTSDLLLIAETLVVETVYPSLANVFPAVIPFEQEMHEMFGLAPADALRPRRWLRGPYPRDLYPLRRDRTTEGLRRRLAEFDEPWTGDRSEGDDLSDRPPEPGHGRVILPVGPIHAGIIEPGRFVFEISGEVIEEVTIELGYTHKGIERLFQTSASLHDGWRLAEQVSADNGFAHSLAYCRAAEALAGVAIPQAAEQLRALFLELERICNHVGTVMGLAHDVSLEALAGDLGCVWEGLMRLNEEVAGHRLLAGLNRVGGIVLPHPLQPDELRRRLGNLLRQFNRLGNTLAHRDIFRARSLETGRLPRNAALRLGVAGPPARASGVQRDFRLLHPTGLYKKPWAREALAPAPGASGFADEAANGDVYARFLTRLDEVRSSGRLVAEILDRMEIGDAADFRAEDVIFDPRRNYAFALGYAEGWRGDVVYFLMQDKLERIYRCKVRDPSTLNWPALREVIIPRKQMGQEEWIETILPDFPLINKSFDLSYSGNDL